MIARPQPQRHAVVLRSALGALLLLLCGTAGSQSAGHDASQASQIRPETTRDVLIPVAQRRHAPDFERAENNGRVFRLSQQRGHVVVLNFWATWCGGCKFELPYFVEYDRKYREQGLLTVGISMDDEGFKVVKPFWQGKQMPYGTVIGSQALADQLGLKGMPFTLLIDKEGRIAIAHAGVLDRDDFDHHIQELLRS